MQDPYVRQDVERIADERIVERLRKVVEALDYALAQIEPRDSDQAGRIGQLRAEIQWALSP